MEDEKHVRGVIESSNHTMPARDLALDESEMQLLEATCQPDAWGTFTAAEGEGGAADDEVREDEAGTEGLLDDETELLGDETELEELPEDDEEAEEFLEEAEEKASLP